MLRWRGIALTNFYAKRWSNSEHSSETLTARPDGWIFLHGGEHAAAPVPTGLQYTVFLQPIATAAIFTLGEPLSLKGDFSDSSNDDWAARHSYIFRDSTGSLFNPFHNYSPVHYTGVSRLPKLDAAELRSASDSYPPSITAEYLHLPPDPHARIPAWRCIFPEASGSPSIPRRRRRKIPACSREWPSISTGCSLPGANG